MRAAITLSLIRRLVRLATSSGVATLADTIVLVVLCRVLGWSPGFAAIAGCLVGGAVNFAIARSWVFGARTGPVLRQAVAYASLVVIGGAILSGVIVGVLAGSGAPLLVAKGGALVIVLAGWNYPISSRLVFARQYT